MKVFGKEVDGSEEYRLIFSEYNAPEPPIPPFCQNITINDNSGLDLGDYQVLIELNPSDFPNKAAKNGADVRFLDKDRNKLNYWIKEWNDASKTVEIWVKVPSIPANGEAEIEMRYGNQNAESQSDGDGTFKMFDDFDDGSIDSKKWIVNGSSSEFVIEKDGELQIRSKPLTKTDADLVSRSAYGPNVAMKFRANISEGHWLDHKGAGFLSANVGNDFNEVGDSVYLRGEESRLYTLNKYPSPTSETLCTGGKLIEQDYEAGYQTWEIRWLDSEIGYYINDVLRSAHSAEGSSVKITPRFSINTYTAEPVDPAEISVDWIFVRKCASSEPTVQIEAAESAGE